MKSNGQSQKKRTVENRYKSRFYILTASVSIVCNQTAGQYPAMYNPSSLDNHNNYESLLEFAVDLRQIQSISGVDEI